MSEDKKFNGKNTDSNEIEDVNFANTELARRMSNSSVGTEGYWADQEQGELAVLKEDNTNQYEGEQIQIEQGSFVASKGSIQEILNNIRANGDNDYQTTEDDPISNADNIATIKSELVGNQQQEVSYDGYVHPNEQDTPDTKFTSAEKTADNNNSTISKEGADHAIDVSDSSASENVVEGDSAGAKDSNDDLAGAADTDSSGDDFVAGGQGDDALSGGAGNDTIQGNAGDDLIEGGDGQDILVGGSGNDTVSGGEGDDLVAGCEGNDVLSGGAGNDYLIGGEGEDNIHAGVGDDHIYGGAGSDTVDAGEGDDTIFGGIGDDLIEGGAGDDIIFGDNNQGPVLLENGNYDISSGGGLSISVDSLISTAGYNNSFGHYFADSEGNPISGIINFANVKETLGEGNISSITYSADDVPTGAVQVGFFIIPDGGRQNSITDGDQVTFIQNSDGEWTPVLNGEELHGAQGVPAFFSDDNLNSDNLDHTVDSNYSGMQQQLGFEDLVNGGDKDFDDIVMNVTVEGASSDSSNDILSGGAGDDTIFGGSGDDWLSGGLGDDWIDGGSGNDIVQFEGNIDDYVITRHSDGSYTIEDSIADRSGEDHVVNVESFDFGGTTYSSEQIDSSYLDNDGYVVPEITMDSTPSNDWTVEIMEDNNFNDVEPSNWMDDVDINSSFDDYSGFDDSNVEADNQDLSMDADDSGSATYDTP